MIALRPSRIHGVGCFTDAPIRRGSAVQILAPGDFKFVAARDVPRKERHLYGSHAVLTVGGYYAPLDWLRPSLGWYINHAKRPNVSTDDEGETFRAVRHIKPGEELTVDYATLDAAVDNTP